MAEKKNAHKGKFIGAYVDDEHVEKVEAVEKFLDDTLGQRGNRSHALRYILSCFDTAWLEQYPKDRASAMEVAQTIN